MNPSFPSLSSPQRLGVSQPIASGKKVPLRKGHSLMDWIRLTKSGTDLRGTGPRMINVSLEELKKHNKEDDAWMAIRGFVYNVTKYMNYHPGGADELLRGAGKDATALFDEIHRWVNFESMLQACLVGKLAEHKTTNLKPTFLVPPPMTLLKPGSANQKKESVTPSNNSASIPQVVVSSSATLPVMETEWSQTADSVSIVCATKCLAINVTNIICDIEEHGMSLKGQVIVEDNKCFIINIVLCNQVDSIFDIRVRENSGIVELILCKSQKLQQWSTLGTFSENHGEKVDLKKPDHIVRLCKLVDKSEITYDTFLFKFHLPKTCHMRVPIGSHVYLQADIEDVSISRPYTVVTPNFAAEDADQEVCKDEIFLMIKIYPFGAFTSYLNTLSLGDEIVISNYEGSFDTTMIAGFESIFLLCGGTGFTPMVRLIHHCIYNTDKYVHVSFYNKKTQDILCGAELVKLKQKFPDRFSTEHILSDAGKDWNGKTGRINLVYLSDLMNSDSLSKFVCVCGTPGFTRLALNLLNELGIKQSNIHAFTN